MLIVDDVITAGTAIRQSMDLLASVQARPVGVALALDRQEKGGDTPLSAVQSVQQEFGLHVVSIVGLNQLLAYLQVRKHGESRGLGLAVGCERISASQFTSFSALTAIRLLFSVWRCQEGGASEAAGSLEAIRKYREQYGVSEP